MKWIQRIFLGCLVLMTVLCVACAGLESPLIQESWKYFRAQHQEPAFSKYVSDAVLFESFADGCIHYTAWRPGKGITARWPCFGTSWLQTVPPDKGMSIARWVPGTATPKMSSYTAGYVSSARRLPGEGRIRWTPDGQFLVTSVYILVYDDSRGWVPVGSRLVLATEDCRVQVVMVEGKGWRLWDPDLSVRGLLAYARGPWDDDAAPREIVVRDFRHDKTWVIGEGVNPTWSPDGEWLAYTGYDGLYVARWDGSQKRRVVAFATQEPMEDVLNWDGPEVWWKWPPRPDWSPDGKWLIYHRREGEGYNIYKLNVATGEEELLIRDGVHPQWRWKRQAVAYPEDWGLAGP